MTEIKRSTLTLPENVEFFRHPNETNYGMLSWANLIYGLLHGHLKPNRVVPFEVTNGLTLQWEGKNRSKNKVTVRVTNERKFLLIESADFARSKQMIKISTFIGQLPSQERLALRVLQKRDIYEVFFMRLINREVHGK